MENKTCLSKKDVLLIVGCVIFLLVNLGAIGNGGRSRAKSAVCLNNLKKWGSIFKTYTDDHDGKFFTGWVFSDSSATRLWHTALRSYYSKDTGVRFCPVATKTRDDLDRTSMNFVGGKFAAWGFRYKTLWSAPPNIDCGSYGINWWVSNPPVGESIGAPAYAERRWRTLDVKGGGNVPMLLDSSYVDGGIHGNDEEVPPVDTSDSFVSYINGMSHFCMNRHDMAVNGVFLDMSAKRIKLKDLWGLKWHRQYETLNAGPSDDDWGWLK